VTTAIVGLVGVIVGGLISGSIQLFLAHRADKRNARTGARLIRAELCAYRELEAQWVRIGQLRWEWWTAPVAWPQYSGSAAAALSDREWSALEAGYAVIRESGESREMLASLPTETAALRARIDRDSETEGRRNEGIAAINAAIGALGRVAGRQSSSVPAPKGDEPGSGEKTVA
jgi:hypothetical protein